MSNSIYIDVNAKNASSINETNNRFSYRLPSALELPIGTEIGLQSSIINLKGIIIPQNVCSCLHVQKMFA